MTQLDMLMPSGLSIVLLGGIILLILYKLIPIIAVNWVRTPTHHPLNNSALATSQAGTA
jgi:hypothetical protein